MPIRYTRSHWKQGTDLPKADRPQPPVIVTSVKKHRRNSSHKAIAKQRIKKKIKWGTDNCAQSIAHNGFGGLSRVFPVLIPNFRGLFQVEDRGIWFQYRDSRDRFQVASWHHGKLKRFPGCPVVLFAELLRSNVYLEGSQAICKTRDWTIKLADRQKTDPDAKIVPIKRTPAYKVAIGVAAHAQNMSDWQREARPVAQLLKYDIKQAARALPEQRIARRNAIAVIDEKDVLAARAKRRAATLVKK